MVELRGKLRQIVRAHAGGWKRAERVAETVRDEREPGGDAEQGLRPRRERLVKRGEDRKEKRSGVDHAVHVPAPRRPRA